MPIVQPYEIKADKVTLKALIYGQPGIGKSTLALSMPRPLLIDADGGVLRVQAQHRVPTLQVRNYQEILDELTPKNLEPYDTLVFDTAGKLLDYINAHIVMLDPKNGTRNGNLSMQGWGVRAYTFENLVKSASTMGKHLVFVAHEKEDRNGDTRVVRPDFGGGKAGGDLIKDLDLVGYMEAIGKRRTICFAPSEQYYAKNAASIDDVVMIPDLKEKGAENNFLTTILERHKAALNEECGQVSEYNALMDAIGKDIAAVTNAEEANTLIKKLGKMEHIWDSRERGWKLLKEAAKALGLGYAKESGFTAKTEAA